MELQEMEIIQAEKEKDISAQEQRPLDDEGEEMAKYKRASFDLPLNVAKTDPLR